MFMMAVVQDPVRSREKQKYKQVDADKKKQEKIDMHWTRLPLLSRIRERARP